MQIDKPLFIKFENLNEFMDHEERKLGLLGSGEGIAAHSQ